ncbi:MAG TPA: ATP-binding cassette domain-containing protein, partial [Gammaproteobacteria bacterium]|nr:ATP-binding cassette domain-containing protein [Gammaproteobacteria bacterium]
MLSAHNIVAGYVDEIDILQKVSVDVEQNKITSVIGPNGSGKSTLMRVICGFLTPKSGQVLWDGTDLTGRPSHGMAELGICYLPQERTVFAHL